MKGSIRFNNDIIAEVDVDPSAASGSRLTSCKNLIDGQELGGGGGSSLPSVTSADEGKVLAVNASGEWAAELYNELDVIIEAGTQFSAISSSTTFTYVKGSFATMSALIGAKKPVRGVLITTNNPDGESGGTAPFVCITPGEYGGEIYLTYFNGYHDVMQSIVAGSDNSLTSTAD